MDCPCCSHFKEISMKVIKMAALAATVFVGALAPAQAQNTGLIPVRAKIGVLYPTNSGTRNLTGSTHLGGEVDVALPRLLGGRYMVSAGLFQGSDSGNKLRMIPITIGRYFQPPNPVGSLTGNVYFGAGVGAYLLRGQAGGTSDSKISPGAYASAGYQFPNPYFIEAKYHLTGKVNGLRPGGLAVMVGRHF
jgi:hypothetical protein